MAETSGLLFALIEAFEEGLTDPRHGPQAVHRLGDVMTIAFLSVLSNGGTWEDMVDFGEAREEWLRQFLELPGGIPSISTFRRVISQLNPKELGPIL